MLTERVDVIATTVSGSIQDWQKVERIQPLFREQGLQRVHLHVVTSHQAARETARKVLQEGGRLPISAGGSGTFKNVLEGYNEQECDEEEEEDPEKAAPQENTSWGNLKSSFR